MDGKAFLFGGEDSQGSFGDTWMFDLAKREWIDLSPLAAASGSAPSARQAHGMASVDGLVVVFGGYQYLGSPQQHLRVKLFADTWFLDTSKPLSLLPPQPSTLNPDPSTRIPQPYILNPKP